MSEVATLLRAELVHEGKTLVGHTTVITPNSSFVRLDEEIDLGTAVMLELSFRSAIEPLRFRARVTEHRRAAGPGEFAGLWLELEACSDTDATGLQRVLDATPRQRPVQVLLVEDSTLTRDVFLHAAERADSTHVHIDGVGDPDAAWDKVQTGQYDVLVVDHFLTTGSGADLIARLRADPRTSSIPVLGISIGGKVARDAMLSAGVDVFLDKPVRVRDLLATLARMSGLQESA